MFEVESDTDTILTTTISLDDEEGMKVLTIQPEDPPVHLKMVPTCEANVDLASTEKNGNTSRHRGHLKFLMSSMSSLMCDSNYCDLELILGQQSLRMLVNKLVAGLSIHALHDLPAKLEECDLIILPDHSLQEITQCFNLINSENIVEQSVGSSVSQLDKVKEFENGILHSSEESHSSDYSDIKCEECGLIFKCNKSLLDHRASCRKKESLKFKCQICNEGFQNMYSLISHEVESHETETKDPMSTTFYEPVRCFKCGSEMLTARHLAAHNCGHTKYPPTKCSQCSKILVNRSQMLSHSCPRVIRPLDLEIDNYDSQACLVCGKIFISIRSAIIHEVEECNFLKRIYHPNLRLKNYHCITCDRNFVVKKKFKMHMEKHDREAQEQQNLKEFSLTKNTNEENVDPSVRDCLSEVFEDGNKSEHGTLGNQDGKIEMVTTFADYEKTGGEESTVFYKAFKQLQVRL